MFWQIAVLVLLLPNKITSLANKYNALHFGTSSADFISYTRDMSPFRNSLTACMWIKRVDTSSSDVVFHYHTGSSRYEILIGSDGGFNRVVGDQVLRYSQSYFQTPAGQWFSYCLSWSRSTNTIQLYLDGQLVRSGKTSSGSWRELYTTGTLSFNRFVDTASPSQVFGGQLFEFNMFPEVLSAESIRKIAQGGLCFDMSEVSSVPVLKWEEVMAKSRSGNVTEVIGCESLHVLEQKIEKLSEKVSSLTSELNSTMTNLDSVKSELNSTMTNLDSVKSELNSTKTNLDSVKSELNSTKTNLDSVSTQLTQTQDELKTVRKTLNKTETNLETCNSTLLEKTDQLELTVGKLENCSSSLKETIKELQEARKLEDVTKWDVLYTSPYFNRFLTSELIDQLKSSWDVLGKLVFKTLANCFICFYLSFRIFHVLLTKSHIKYPIKLNFFPSNAFFAPKAQKGITKGF